MKTEGEPTEKKESPCVSGKEVECGLEGSLISIFESQQRDVPSRALLRPLLLQSHLLDEEEPCVESDEGALVSCDLDSACTVTAVCPVAFTSSLNGSSIPRFTAKAGTITGCFFCPAKRILLVSIPRQSSSVLLLCEPPHWNFRPKASWTSKGCCQAPLQTLGNTTH